jgi:UDP-glucose 4-epimerase
MSFNGKKVLVTGHKGFVGRNLIRELKKQHAKVVILSDSQGNPIDVRDWTKIRQIKDIEIIYHLAAVTSVPYSFENPKDTYDVNINGTLNILELGRLNKIDKFIFISSYIYGTPHYLPINETHKPAPTNPYACSKLIGETLCASYNSDCGLKPTIFRPFNIYGPGQADHFLIPSIMKQLKNGKINLKDSLPKRDFLYISDFINALILAGTQDLNFDIINLGYGKSYSVSEIVDKIIDLYGKPVSVEYKNESRKNEIMDTVSDIRKAKRMLGWNPLIDIDKGLEMILLNFGSL